MKKGLFPSSRSFCLAGSSCFLLLWSLLERSSETKSFWSLYFFVLKALIAALRTDSFSGNLPKKTWMGLGFRLGLGLPVGGVLWALWMSKSDSSGSTNSLRKEFMKLIQLPAGPEPSDSSGILKNTRLFLLALFSSSSTLSTLFQFQLACHQASYHSCHYEKIPGF